MISWKDRIVTASMPIVAWLLMIVFTPLGILALISSYFIAKRIASDFAATQVLRYFDFCLTIFVFAFVFGLINSGLNIAARDGDITIPLVSSGLLKQIFILVIAVYSIIGTILHIIFPLLGKGLVMPLSLKIFENVRGRRSNKLSQQDVQKSHASA